MSLNLKRRCEIFANLIDEPVNNPKCTIVFFSERRTFENRIVRYPNVRETYLSNRSHAKNKIYDQFTFLKIIIKKSQKRIALTSVRLKRIRFCRSVAH